MPGLKFNPVLCLIIIVNAFGAHANIFDYIKCLDLSVKDVPALLPKGLLDNIQLLPNNTQLWKILQDTLDLSTTLQLLDFRNVTQVIKDDGYPVESHTITTGDGYISTYFRIPHGKNNSNSRLPRPPVLLQHGFFTYSGSWIFVETKDCLPYILADAGYDVWLGNARGTVQSGGHVFPDIVPAEYWRFDWETMGHFDIPAGIDYILDKTSYPQLYYIGHSMGTTMAFAGLSLQPHYSEKIKVLFALAPVAWLYESTTVLRLVAPLELALQTLSSANVVPLPDALNRTYLNSLLQTTLGPVCSLPAVSSVVCGNLAFLICGYDFDNTNFKAFSRLLGRFVSPISLNTLRHFLQSAIRNHFRRFDYGPPENYRRYGNCIPPDYDVAAIRTKTVFFYGDRDALAQIKDVEKLIQNYNPDLVIRHRMPHTWNHLDYLIANNARRFVAHPIMQYMKDNPIEL